MYELEYTRRRDDLDGRKVAARIEQAMARRFSEGRLWQLQSELEYTVYAAALCAGNQLSLKAPLELLCLAAFQRVHDWHAGRILTTPEECVRSLTVCHALIYVTNALEALEQALADEQKAA